MGKSITPTYRVEVTESTVTPHGVRHQTTQSAWRGKATDSALEAWVLAYGKSLEAGGVNSHVSEMLGYIPYPNAAQIVHQKTGTITATWHAGMFQVW